MDSSLLGSEHAMSFTKNMMMYFVVSCINRCRMLYHVVVFRLLNSCMLQVGPFFGRTQALRIERSPVHSVVKFC